MDSSHLESVYDSKIVPSHIFTYFIQCRVNVKYNAYMIYETE